MLKKVNKKVCINGIFFAFKISVSEKIEKNNIIKGAVGKLSK